MNAGKLTTKAMLSVLNGEHNTAQLDGWVRVHLDDKHRRLRVELIDREGEALIVWDLAVPSGVGITADFRNSLSGSATIIVECP